MLLTYHAPHSKTQEPRLGIIIRKKKESWIQRSFFKKNEEILALVCFCISFSRPIHAIIATNEIWTLENIPDLTQIANKSACPKEGNKLEVIAMGSVIDSSHFVATPSITTPEKSDRVSTFSGVSGHAFLTNLIRKLNLDYVYSDSSSRTTINVNWSLSSNC